MDTLSTSMTFCMGNLLVDFQQKRPGMQNFIDFFIVGSNEHVAVTKAPFVDFS